MPRLKVHSFILFWKVQTLPVTVSKSHLFIRCLKLNALPNSARSSRFEVGRNRKRSTRHEMKYFGVPSMLRHTSSPCTSAVLSRWFFEVSHSHWKTCTLLYSADYFRKRDIINEHALIADAGWAENGQADSRVIRVVTKLGIANVIAGAVCCRAKHHSTLYTESRDSQTLWDANSKLLLHIIHEIHGSATTRPSKHLSLNTLSAT